MKWLINTWRGFTFIGTVEFSTRGAAARALPKYRTMRIHRDSARCEYNVTLPER